MISYSPQSLALICLCADMIEKPLSPGQFQRLEKLLKKARLSAADLFAMDEARLDEVLRHDGELMTKVVTRREYLKQILSILARYEKTGIALITIYDDTYPEILKKRLRQEAPLYFYVCGAWPAGKAKGSALIGSDQAVSLGLDISAVYVRQDITLLTRARVKSEEQVLRRHLQAGGQGVIVSGGNLDLLRKRHRQAVKERRLTIVSITEGEGDRLSHLLADRVLMCLADINLVVAAPYRQGSLYFAARYYAKRVGEGMAVLIDGDVKSAAALVKEGARPLSLARIQEEDDLFALMDSDLPGRYEAAGYEQLTIFDFEG